MCFIDYVIVVRLDNMNSKKHFEIENAVFYKGKLYFVGVDTNILFCFDIENEKVSYVMTLEEEPKHVLYRNCVLYEDCMWLIPWAAERIACVYLNENKIVYYDIEFRNVTCLNEKHADCAYYYTYKLSDSQIIAVPRKYDKPMIIDMAEKKISFLDMEYDNNKILFITGYKIDSKLYFVPDVGENILTYDLDSNKTGKIEDNFLKGLYEGAMDDGEYIWFAPRNSEYIIKLDKEKKQIKKIKYDRNGDESFWEIIKKNEILYIIPRSGERILLYDNQKKAFDSICLNDKKIGARCIDMQNGFWVTELIDKQLLNVACNQIYTPSIDYAEYVKFWKKIVDSNSKEYLKKTYFNNQVTKEDVFPLSAFVDFVTKE